MNSLGCLLALFSTYSIPQDRMSAAMEVEKWSRKDLLIIAYIESAFVADAESHVGAFGLMQLMPVVKKELVRVRTCGADGDLKMTADNVEMGKCFIDYLMSQYGNMDYVLLHYNGGGRAVRRWIAGESVPAESAKYLVKYHRIRADIPECS